MFGCTGTANDSVTIEPAPIAAFTFTGQHVLAIAFYLAIHQQEILFLIYGISGYGYFKLTKPYCQL